MQDCNRYRAVPRSAALGLCRMANWVSLGHGIAHTSSAWVFIYLAVLPWACACCLLCRDTEVLAEMRVGGVGT